MFLLNVKKKRLVDRNERHCDVTTATRQQELPLPEKKFRRRRCCRLSMVDIFRFH